MFELLWLLLPVAAASGWFAARRSAPPPPAGTNVTPVYFKGLNYLLNEQPDKAIDVFLKLLEVDGETVETHLTLGNLFRRRGEVDRAIKLHQNLIARTNLSQDQRAQALLELGRDYMSAGLFDRAESLYRELVDMGLYCEEALKHLKSIYQHEKEWGRCLEVAQRLERETGRSQQHEIAHYYCELAEEALRNGDQTRAEEHLTEAERVDGRSVRASIMQARLWAGKGKCERAIAVYQRAVDQGPEYLSEILPALKECYLQLGRTGELRQYLEQCYHRHRSRAAMLALAEVLLEEEGEKPALQFITGHLRRHPDLKALRTLIGLKLARDGDSDKNRNMAVFHDLVSAYLETQPDYQCTRCGFSASRLHWQCPGCKAWGSVKPLEGLPAKPRNF